MKLPIKYYKGVIGQGPYRQRLILPPENMPELEGYVAKFQASSVCTNERAVFVPNGNDYDCRTDHYYIMFEPEERNEQAFARYYFSADELYKAYVSNWPILQAKLMEHRIRTVGSGPGSLILAEYPMNPRSSQRLLMSWMIAPEDYAFAFGLQYNPVTNEGLVCHKNSGCFTVLEEYPIPDIKILQDNKKELSSLLKDLDTARDAYDAQSDVTTAITDRIHELTGISIPHIDNHERQPYRLSLFNIIEFLPSGQHILANLFLAVLTSLRTHRRI